MCLTEGDRGEKKLHKCSFEVSMKPKCSNVIKICEDRVAMIDTGCLKQTANILMSLKCAFLIDGPKPPSTTTVRCCWPAQRRFRKVAICRVAMQILRIWRPAFAMQLHDRSSLSRSTFSCNRKRVCRTRPEAIQINFLVDHSEYLMTAISFLNVNVQSASLVYYLSISGIGSKVMARKNTMSSGRILRN